MESIIEPKEDKKLKHNHLKSILKQRIWSWLTVICISLTSASCADTIESVQAFKNESTAEIPHVENVSEVPPPKLIQELSPSFDRYQPQVKIISPLNNQTIEGTSVAVQLEVKDLPIFKHPDLQMGPHLHFFLDNQPYQAVYSTDEPILLEDLAPGSHTIRVFASRPWHESFKNEGAYAQTTFHVFTATDENNPDPEQPLLTYSRPQGNYGAQPIMVDFYLTNAPLHVVAQQYPDDDIADWRIRVTVNGESFLMDTWQPIYLQGFHPGQNWVKLEFIDEKGEIVKNAFNSTVRAIDYDPKLKDTLAKLVTDKLPLSQGRAIVDPNYNLQEVTPPPEATEETTQPPLMEPATSEITPPESISPREANQVMESTGNQEQESEQEVSEELETIDNE